MFARYLTRATFEPILPSMSTTKYAVFFTVRTAGEERPTATEQTVIVDSDGGAGVAIMKALGVERSAIYDITTKRGFTEAGVAGFWHVAAQKA